MRRITFSAGPVPSRTTLDLRIPLAMLGGPLSQSELAGIAATLPEDMIEKTFTCMDCGFVTTSLAAANRHQAAQAKIHTRWQRLRRRLALWAAAIGLTHLGTSFSLEEPSP